jgi:hypothetical protein
MHVRLTFFFILSSFEQALPPEVRNKWAHQGARNGLRSLGTSTKLTYADVC